MVEEILIRGGKSQIHREHGMRERSHEKLGKICTDEPISKALQDVCDEIRAHVQTTLDQPNAVKGDARVVDQALRLATTACMSSWAEKKHQGRDVQVITIVLMQITRKQPGMVMGINLRSCYPSW
jgi:hypothetical protein